MKRIAFVLVLISMPGILGLSRVPNSQLQTEQDHVAWVAEVMAHMQTVTPGMTRADLLEVFTTEGGISTPSQRTYVSRDCPYFHVDVEFQAIAPLPIDADGRLIEDPADVIVSISRPYLGYGVLD
jgi:hypothetical protein